jgi:hypothetical protein
LRFLGFAAVFVMCWGVVHLPLYAHEAGDRPLYQADGTAIRHGEVPYRDFALEYPPAALPVFVAPTFSGASYDAAFGWLMAACGVGCLILVSLSRPDRFALPFVALSPLVIGNLGLSRFDFWPALLTVAALVLFRRDRNVIGAAVLGLAISAKLYAAVLIPLAVIWTVRRRGRRELVRAGGALIAVLAVAFVPFAVLAPHGLWSSLSGQISRPLQVETLAASFLLTFAHPVIMSSHGSKNVVGYDWLAALTSGAVALEAVTLWIAFARGPVQPARLARYSAACVCAFVAFGKVLSPQFLIWLVPLFALVHGRRGLAAAALLAIAFAFTLVWFPDRYLTSYVYDPHRLAWLVLLRNLVLVGSLAALALPTSWKLPSWSRFQRKPTPATY